MKYSVCTETVTTKIKVNTKVNVFICTNIQIQQLYFGQNRSILKLKVYINTLSLDASCFFNCKLTKICIHHLEL